MKLDLETIESLIRQAFPQTTVVSYRPLASDSVKRNYVVQLRNPSVEVVLRIYRHDTPPRIVEKEMHVLRVVMPETGVPTPRVIHFDGHRTLVDTPYAVLNTLPGEPLEKALPRMNELDQEAVGYEMGRYLAKLHSIPLGKFGEFFGDDPSASISEKGYTVARVVEWLKVCKENSLLDESTIVELERFVGQTQVLNCEKACFVHGSYHARNINVEEGIAGFHVTGVLDFEHAQGWSPEWDMATLFGYVFDTHPALVKGFLDGYTDVGNLPDNFWDRIEIYRPVVNIRCLVHAHYTGDEALLETYRARLTRFTSAAGKMEVV